MLNDWVDSSRVLFGVHEGVLDVRMTGDIRCTKFVIRFSQDIRFPDRTHLMRFNA